MSKGTSGMPVPLTEKAGAGQLDFGDKGGECRGHKLTGGLVSGKIVGGGTPLNLGILESLAGNTLLHVWLHPVKCIALVRRAGSKRCGSAQGGPEKGEQLHVAIDLWKLEAVKAFSNGGTRAYLNDSQ